MYTYAEDGDIKCMCVSHVDDLMFAAKPGYEHLMQKVLDRFEVRELNEGSFRFCGREIEQNEHGDIHVTCKDTAEKTLPINFHMNGRSGEDKATVGEISQMRSVIGSLAWVSRQCRPGLSYSCSRLQSVVNGAQVKHLIECNRVLQDAIAESHKGICYKAGSFDWNKSVLVTITDASWAGEKIIRADDRVYARRSQMGRVVLLCDPEIWDGDVANGHIISWKSQLITRLCRSTMQAETQASVRGVEESTFVRAAIADMRGHQGAGSAWEQSSKQTMSHLWLTDCESLHSQLINPVMTTNEDKRLEIDIGSLRQHLWEDSKGEPLDAILNQWPDKCRWIDTSTMLADPLTKMMKADRLEEFLYTGKLDLQPTPESLHSKLMKQAGRKKAKESAESDKAV
jgi:hypothetical protein